MKKLCYLIAFLLLIAAAIFFANVRERVASVAPAKSVASAVAEPLAVILTPMGGDDKADRDIADLQGKIRQDRSANLLIERLGWAFIAKARLSSDPGFYPLAEQAANVIRTRAPADPGAALLLGHTYHAMHRFAEAEAVARELTAHRDFVFDYALLGDALMEQGKLGAAVDAYQKMVDLKPGLQSYSRIAHIRWLKGDLAGALDASKLAASSGSPREPEPLAWACTRLAFYELESGDVESALASLDRALQFAAGYAPALLMRGRALLAQGKTEDAIAPITTAADASPLPEYLWTLADALRAAGRETEAEGAEAKLQTSGASSDPRTFALFLASRGLDPALATKLASSELANRQDIFTYDALAWSQFASGNIAEAQANMARALAEGTQDARLFYHAGAIAASAGDSRSALDFNTKAHRLELVLLPSERHQLGEQTAALTSTESKVSSK
ncbi:MAG: tetratricopeptide repeat protein [Chthoniobacterales bacterium]